jgi:hypothetical protein
MLFLYGADKRECYRRIKLLCCSLFIVTSYLNSTQLNVCVSACYGHHQNHSIGDLHNFPFGKQALPGKGANGVVRKPLKATWYSRTRYLASLLSCTLPDIFKELCQCHLIQNANPTPMGMLLSS